MAHRACGSLRGGGTLNEFSRRIAQKKAQRHDPAVALRNLFSGLLLYYWAVFCVVWW
jgi:hypothetical protein